MWPVIVCRVADVIMGTCFHCVACNFSSESTAPSSCSPFINDCADA